MQVNFVAELWRHSESTGSWHFVTLPAELAKAVQQISKGRRGHWGTLQVVASIGASQWKTSIFRDSKRQSYLLPIKASIRKSQALEVGQPVTVALEIELGLAAAQI